MPTERIHHSALRPGGRRAVRAEPSPPAVGPPVPDPPPPRPPAEYAVESIGFAAASAAVALTAPHIPAEGPHLLAELALLLLAALLAAMAEHHARASRRRWPWLPVGSAYAAVAVGAATSRAADELLALLAALG